MNYKNYKQNRNKEQHLQISVVPEFLTRKWLVRYYSFIYYSLQNVNCISTCV